MGLVTGFELYVDGVKKFESSYSGFNIEILSDQFFDVGGVSTGSYTYNEGQYAGWTTTQGGTTPDYEVGDTFYVNGQMYLYSIPATTSTGKTQLGTRTITKKMFGTREITKEVVNGVVVYEKQASATISFTIAGTTYQADNGMTWGDWVNSSYNTGGFIIVDDNVRAPNYNVVGIVICDYSQEITTPIIANQAYIVFSDQACD